MARSKKTPAIEPSGFFALRTPLLPWQELEAWASGLRAPRTGDADAEALGEALDADRALLRQRLRELLERPEIREALFVAAPELEIGIDVWRRNPDGKKGRRAEQSLVRYFLRMTARSTPFGLFSGCSVGEIGPETRLELAARGDYRRHTRLDTDYLFALTEALGSDPGIRRRLRYRPNSSLYDAAGRLRYAESRLVGRTRVHHLMAVEADGYLKETLERAAAGATFAELAAALVAGDPDGEIEQDEAEAYVEELIDAQLLVSGLAPLVTGRESIHDLLDQLAELPAAAPVVAGLTEIRDRLAALDGTGLGAEPDVYRSLATRLEELPAEVRLPRLFQVDMVKPAPAASLGPQVVGEIERGLAILQRFAAPPSEDGLSRFREDFKARYGEDRAVPLLVALDEEAGIGFDGSRSSDVSPLLAGLRLPASSGEPTVSWGRRTELLFDKLQDAVAADAMEISLSRRDLAALGESQTRPLPDSFQVMASIAAESAEAVDRGKFELHLKNAYGPSGAQLLGRFCHADATLRRRVEEHLRREEAMQPDAIFAEVVHLPEGRIGNILARPVLRGHEIPFLGRSGAVAERQIRVADLLVTVSGQEIHLHCARSGRRVVPRLAAAHNYWGRGLAVYRFLGSLQVQGVAPTLQWSWGGLASAGFLPRVRSGRLVLSRARWKVTGAEIRELTGSREPERFTAVRTWRAGRRLPRRVALQDGDNELLVDFDNVLGVDTFLALVKNRPGCTLVELFPAADRLCVGSSEGVFHHELVVPFVRRRSQPRPVRAPLVRSGGPRTFLPGSEWLYAKLYTGTATADRLLTGVVRTAVEEARASGAADGWFFLRYGDPEWHLRLRFHGDPRRLQGEVLPSLHRALSPLAADGWLSGLQIDAYERELERYGGAEGMAASERLFEIDSDAVLELLALVQGDEGAEARWRLAFAGADRLLADLGFDAGAGSAILKRIQASWAREFHVDGGFRKQLARRLRKERPALERLLEGDGGEDELLVRGLAVLGRRSRRLAPVRDELRALQRSGRLTRPLEDLAVSYVHMFTNRLLRSQGRAHELVIYDFLHQIARSRAARRRDSSAKKALSPAA